VGQPGTVVAPVADSLISLDTPPEGFTADGTLHFSGFVLPAGGQFVVFVDDDERLGDGSDTLNAPDQSEPMRRLVTSTNSAAATDLTPGHHYFWNVVALASDGSVIAGSGLSSFIACAGAGCGGPPPPDAGLTLDDGGVLEVGPPLFASTPEGYAACGQAYAYSRDGRPEVAGSGPFHFSIEPPAGAMLPAGVSVDADTGEVQWTPSAQQEGVQHFDLVVTGPGGTARQALDVVVVCRDASSPGVKCGCSGSSDALATLVLAALAVRRRRTR
jgi:MYXO-CTERM domain-containing protein